MQKSRVYIVLVIFCVLFQTKEARIIATTVYVQSGAEASTEKGTKENPFETITKAYDSLAGSTSDSSLTIKIIKEGTGQEVLSAEAIAFSIDSGITIAGVEMAEGTGAETKTKVEIDCGVTPGTDLFTCKQTVIFSYLTFDFPTTLEQDSYALKANAGTFALIHADAESRSLTIAICEFIRPEAGGSSVGIHLVKVSAGSLTMTGVESISVSEVKCSVTPFLVDGANEVSLASLNLKKITSSSSAVVKIIGKCDEAISVIVDVCTFTECTSSKEMDTDACGALYVESSGTESTFEIGNTNPTTFTTCTCTNGKSGGIYLKMTGITEANHLSWGTEVKLEFDGCTATGSKSTGLYLDVPVNLHEEIAVAMKCGFASSYIRGTHDWIVAAKKSDGSAGDVDFTAEYFDPEQPPTMEPTTIYVGQSGTSDANGETFEIPVNTLEKAITLLTGDPVEGGYHIKVIATGELFASEAVAFDKEKGITVVGVDKQGNEGEDQTEIEAKATIVCSMIDGVDLFTCTHTVEFREISFKFGTLTGTNSLIHATTASTSLRLISCDFVRPTPLKSGRNTEGDEPQALGTTLVKVEAGTLNMETITCTATENPILFSASPFLITGVTKVSLKDLQLSEITSKTGPVMKIVGGNGKSIAVTLDGCEFSLCKSEEASADTAKSGTLYVESDNSESTFAILDTSTTTFASCTCAYGKSGGIYLKMDGVEDATKFTWPSSGKIIFTGCTAGTGNTQKQTGLYLEVKTSVFEAIAADMHGKFASGYMQQNDNWVVAAFGGADIGDIDFTVMYFDPDEPPKPPVTTAYVQSGAGASSGDGTKEKPYGTILGAYDLLAETSGQGFDVKIITAQNALKAESIIFDKTSGITIKGIDNEEMSAKVEIDCGVTPGTDLFTCKQTVIFSYLTFDFPTTLEQDSYALKANAGTFALIHADAESRSLTIAICEFIRPEAGGSSVGIHLVKVSAGSLTMTGVESISVSEVKCSVTPFLVDGANEVSLASLNLKKITSSSSAVVKIIGKCDEAISVIVDVCTFTECTSSKEMDTDACGALYVESSGTESTFEIGNTNPTTFTTCTCTNGKSGGIYLKMTGITEANHLSWGTEVKLEFDGCTATGSKSTGLYLDVPVNLHEEIAVAMKCGFASSYIRGTHDWIVAAKKSDGSAGDVDFTAEYFDPYLPPTPPTPISVVYLKCDANSTGLSFNEPIGRFSSAYYLFSFSSSLKMYSMSIIADYDMIKAEAMIFDRSDQLTIEGIENAEGMNQYANIDCDVGPESNLFTCKKSVTFKYLSFVFPLSLSSKGKSQFVKVTDSFALIISEGVDAKLAIINCRFIRPHESESEKENVVDFHLVKVNGGALNMSNVECVDESNKATFQSPLFEIEGASDIVIESVKISNVKVKDGAAISIADGREEASSVVIDGLNMECIESKNSETAGLSIILSSEESSVSIGRESKCTFKSCSAQEGKAGAMYIEMEKAISNLELPAEGNLEIDETNTGKDSSGASLCIVSPDFEEFSQQEDAFEFAKDYSDESAAGWIVGAADVDAKPIDVYEKYLKEEKDEGKKEEEGKEDGKEKQGFEGSNESKPFASWIIIVILACMIVVIVVVFSVLLFVEKKKNSKKMWVNENDEEEEEEGEEEDDDDEKKTKRRMQREKERKGKDRTTNNPVKEANSNRNGNELAKRNLSSTRNNINKSEEQMQKAERKEGISGEFIEETIKQVLSPSLSCSSSLMNKEGSQANQMNVNLKEFVTETNTFSPQSNKQNEETRMTDEEIYENSSEEKEIKKRKKGKKAKGKKEKKSEDLIANIELVNEEAMEEEQEESEDVKQEQKKRKKKKKKKTKKLERNEEEEI